VGPPDGALVAAGGGPIEGQILERFVELAGGKRARIVVIPTAHAGDSFSDLWKGLKPFRDAGAAGVTVLHTRDRDVADSPQFVETLQQATGVWISGGQQWRLVDAYLDTRTHRELAAVLTRGGVVGGTSAGASMLASFLVRGSKDDRGRVMAEGYLRGFGFLKAVAVDQHLITRSRQADLFQVLGRRPDLLGIGLDEGAAIVVRGDRAEVIGISQVAVYGARDVVDQPYYFLSPGQVFDLASRTRVGTPATDRPH
jgi:cyanophycinase